MVSEVGFDSDFLSHAPNHSVENVGVSLCTELESAGYGKMECYFSIAKNLVKAHLPKYQHDQLEDDLHCCRTFDALLM